MKTANAAQLLNNFPKIHKESVLLSEKREPWPWCWKAQALVPALAFWVSLGCCWDSQMTSGYQAQGGSASGMGCTTMWILSLLTRTLKSGQDLCYVYVTFEKKKTTRRFLFLLVTGIDGNKGRGHGWTPEVSHWGEQVMPPPKEEMKFVSCARPCHKKVLVESGKMRRQDVGPVSLLLTAKQSLSWYLLEIFWAHPNLW